VDFFERHPVRPSLHLFLRAVIGTCSCLSQISAISKLAQGASMQIADQCDEIGTTLLLSDADLALTIIRIALSRPAGERRATAIQNAKLSYRRICELVGCVQMEGNLLQNVGTKLEAIRAALDEAERAVVPVPGMTAH
jgi:hypothetical protein